MSNPPSGQRPQRTSSSGRVQPNTLSSVDRAMALRDVMDHAVRVQREITEAKPVRRSRSPRAAALVFCFAAMGLSAYSLTARPAVIWGKQFEQGPAYTDASMRLGMYLLAQRLESFRTAAGHYPASLGDIGEGVEGIQYVRLTDSVFELRSSVDSAVVFRSDAAVDAFLGNSIGVIQGDAR